MDHRSITCKSQQRLELRNSKLHCMFVLLKALHNNQLGTISYTAIVMIVDQFVQMSVECLNLDDTQP